MGLQTSMEFLFIYFSESLVVLIKFLFINQVNLFQRRPQIIRIDIICFSSLLSYKNPSFGQLCSFRSCSFLFVQTVCDVALVIKTHFRREMHFSELRHQT